MSPRETGGKTQAKSFLFCRTSYLGQFYLSSLSCICCSLRCYFAAKGSVCSAAKIFYVQFTKLKNLLIQESGL